MSHEGLVNHEWEKNQERAKEGTVKGINETLFCALIVKG